PITKVSLELQPDPELPGVRIEATVKTTGQTGVEMEALTAVSVAALTVYDMVKAVDKGMVISDIRLALKDGGKSGRYEAE
ncbi:MAG: cyclic pyranopterin monophosphate synthase MoaC, partial [Alphaproteobacteria bacterium]